MKIIIYFILATSIFAQDSTMISHIQSQVEIESNLQSYVELEENLIPKKPIFGLSANRSWRSNSKSLINNEINTSSIIKFKKKKPNFIDSDLFLVVVGSAVAFGATAAYLKLESDDYYEKYLDTQDKSYLNKTDKYDLYSGIALAALEINFGYLIYKFLTD